QRGHEGKAEACAHAGRIGADRQIEEIAQLGEVDNVLDDVGNPSRVELVQSGEPLDVFEAGKPQVDAGDCTEKREDLAAVGACAPGQRQTAGQRAQLGALAGAVVADQAEGQAFAQIKVDVIERAHEGAAVHFEDGAAEQVSDPASAIASAAYDRIVDACLGQLDVSHRRDLFVRP